MIYRCFFFFRINRILNRHHFHTRQTGRFNRPGRQIPLSICSGLKSSKETVPTTMAFIFSPFTRFQLKRSIACRVPRSAARADMSGVSGVSRFSLIADLLHRPAATVCISLSPVPGRHRPVQLNRPCPGTDGETCPDQSTPFSDVSGFPGETSSFGLGVLLQLAHPAVPEKMVVFCKPPSVTPLGTTGFTS